MASFRRIAWALPALLWSCGGGPREKLHDLAALAPAAEVLRETGAIDFGTAAARPHLIAGWYRNERGNERREGASVVWSRGDSSLLEFFLTQPRELRAELRCAPWATPQTVRCELNGRRLDELELGPGLRDYTLTLPRAALRAGTNRLTFRYRRVSDGPRRLAVQWDLLRFRPSRQPEAPDRSGDDLFLPFGSGLAYYLDLPGKGELTLPRIEARGAGHLALRTQLEEKEEEGRDLAAGGEQRVRLPGSGPRLVRLALLAVADSPGGAGGLLLRAPQVWGTKPEPKPALTRHSSVDRPNLIVYLVDTLRADRLACYGGEKPTSPALDAFAAEATLFERAVAQSSWTRPSAASVLTGLTPLEHGARTLEARLPEAVITLSERLRQAGYRTAAFSTNPHVSAETGFAQGFDDFQLFTEDSNAQGVNRRVLGWLDARSPEARKHPLFLYVHTIDPHAPYQPPADLARRFAPGVSPAEGRFEAVRQTYATRGVERSRRLARLSALYDAEVAASDRGFGELLAALRERGLYGPSLVVFLADHGEEFDEHGFFGHGTNLFGTSLDIPLIVKWPFQREGRRVAHPATQLDVPPTLLAAAGLPVAAELPGLDLALLAAAPERAHWPGERVVFSHLSYDGREGVSAVQGPWKLVLPLSRKLAPAPQLYRRDVDPGEREDRLEREAIRAGWLQAQIRWQLLQARPIEHGERGKESPVGEEARKALAALGYQ